MENAMFLLALIGGATMVFIAAEWIGEGLENWRDRRQVAREQRAQQAAQRRAATHLCAAQSAEVTGAEPLVRCVAAFTWQRATAAELAAAELAMLSSKTGDDEAEAVTA